MTLTLFMSCIRYCTVQYLVHDMNSRYSVCTVLFIVFVADGPSMSAANAMRRKSPQTLATWDSSFGIDAVEPLLSACLPQDHLHAAVATYALTENGLREGCLYAVRAATGPEASLSPIASCDSLPGLLDIRTLGLDGRNIVLAALADGTVRAFELVRRGDEGSSPELDANGDPLFCFRMLWQWSCYTFPSSGKPRPMILSVDVEPMGPHQCVGDSCVRVCVSDSDGGVHLLLVRIGGVECLGFYPKVHSDSAWTCTVQGMALYSGGDDGVLAVNDTRQGSISAESAVEGDICGKTSASARILKAPHGGVGVTSMIPRPGHDQYLLTGGYDDTVRLWDTRSLRSSVSDLACGGGVWRIKPRVYSSDDSQELLLACMYDGFKVAALTKDDAFNITATYEEHESLAYGAAWLSTDVADGHEAGVGYENACLTGSFYDHSLRLWVI